MSAPSAPPDFERTIPSGSSQGSGGSSGEPPPPLRNLGAYRVLEPLGDGGMGVVYRALDVERDEMVALKTLRRMNTESFARLKAEFRAIADVVHENLVTLHELHIEDGTPYFTMELVEGTDFLSYVRGETVHGLGNPAELDDAGLLRLRQTLVQLVCALSTLHAAGKVHRDIKRTNVMVTPAGRAVLLDFGLAVDPHQNALGGLVGTAAYMSPEQLRGEPVTAAADMFAVGVMLYRALTGVLPAGATAEERRSGQDDTPVSPSQLADNVPDDLEALAMDLLGGDASTRPNAEQVLARLDVEHPSDAVSDRVASSRAAASHRRTVSAATVFVGREDELTALDEALAEVGDVRPTCFNLHGPSGVGKTATVRRWLEQRAIEGHVVLRSRCRERETFPFKAFDGLMDNIADQLDGWTERSLRAAFPNGLGALVRLFPVLAHFDAAVEPQLDDRQEQRRRAAVVLRALLTALWRAQSRRRPLIVWLDDTQWIDADSIKMLEDVLSPPVPCPLMVVVTSRAESQPVWQRQGHVLGAEVEPLRREHAVTLASKLGAEKSPMLPIEDIATESQGNPLLIEQMVRYAQSGGRSKRLSLEEVVLARKALLSPDAQRILETLAVAGHAMRQDVTIDVAAPSGDARAAIAELRAGALVITRGTRPRDLMETWHDRVRHAVAQSLSDGSRARYHGGIARSLERHDDADPAQLAWHFLAAGAPGAAGPHAVLAAAAAAQSLAFDRAAELYALARRCGAPNRDALLRAHADALVDGGRCAEAAPLYVDAAGRAAAGTEGLELRRLAAEQLMVTGRLDEGLAELGTVLRAHGLSMPASSTQATASVMFQYARLKLRGLSFEPKPEEAIRTATLRQIDLCWSAVKGLLSFDSMRAAHFLFTMVHRALAAGERQRVARALAVFGMTMVFPGTASAYRDGTRTIDLAARAAPPDDPYMDGIVSICRGTAEMSVGHFRTGVAGLQAGITTLQDHCPRVHWECAAAMSSIFNALFWLGEISDLAQRATAWRRKGERIGDLFSVVSSTQYGAVATLAGGNTSGARDAAHESLRLWSQNGFHYQHWLANKILIWCDLTDGRPHTAWQRWVRCRRDLGGSGLLRVEIMKYDALLVSGLLEAHVAAGEVELRRVERRANELERMRRIGSEGAALLLRGRAATVRGDRRAPELLRRAAESFEAVEMNNCARVARRRAAAASGCEAELARADDALRAAGVADPVSWTRAFS